MKVSELRQMLYMFPSNAHIVIMVDGYKLDLNADNIYHEDRWVYITPEFND